MSVRLNPCASSKPGHTFSLQLSFQNLPGSILPFLEVTPGASLVSCEGKDRLSFAYLPLARQHLPQYLVREWKINFKKHVAGFLSPFVTFLKPWETFNFHHHHSNDLSVPDFSLCARIPAKRLTWLLYGQYLLYYYYTILIIAHNFIFAYLILTAAPWGILEVLPCLQLRKVGPREVKSFAWQLSAGIQTQPLDPQPKLFSFTPNSLLRSLDQWCHHSLSLGVTSQEIIMVPLKLLLNIVY